ncbi:MAG: YlbF family regulator [Anaerolineae bacterium]
MATAIATDMTDTAVHAAIQTFAQALADTPQFHAFEEAAAMFNQDRAARQAVRLFQEKQRSLQMMQRLGAITPIELDELKKLQQAMLGYLAVTAYVEAQEELVKVCQAAAKEISTVIGLDFASACAPGCCG